MTESEWLPLPTTDIVEDVEDVNVSEMPEPDEPEEGEIDPDDTYTEGRG
jgi:hypothetical protein